VLAIDRLTGISVRATKPKPVYDSGDIIKDTDQLRLGNAPASVILVTRSTCRYCTESMDFYRRLTAKAQEHGVSVVGATDEQLATNVKYLSSHRLAISRVVTVDQANLNITGTPTVIITSRNRVVKAWRGKLAPTLEQEVLDTISIVAASQANH